MFGYITIAAGALPPERQERYRAHYCGLCRTLGERYGALGQMTLSYDMTFLYLLLSSLYEPAFEEGTSRCAPHPLKPHPYIRNKIADYCCDINIALAYHKCMDDWQDDRSPLGLAEAALLKNAYCRVEKLYPEKCAEIKCCLQKLSEVEQRKDLSPDAAANLFARIMGTVYRYQEDLWADTLSRVGEGMGRFIYLMDAYDDLEKDIKRGRYNPLAARSTQPDYEAFVKDSLTMLIAECTEAFETLPLVEDMDILRNILYAGCWTRYQQKQLKREQTAGVPAERRNQTLSESDRHKEDGA